MKLFFGFLIALLLSFSFTNGDEKSHVFSPELMVNEELFRQALNKRFPHLETVYYQFNGSVIFSLHKKKSTNEYLLIILPTLAGNLLVTIDGKKINPLKKPAKLMLATLSYEASGKKKYDFSKPEEEIIGGWITLKPQSIFKVEADIIHPVKIEFYAEYGPSGKITTWLKPLNPEKAKKLLLE